MSKNRLKTWLLLIAAPIVLILAGVPSLWVYMKVTATPLHPTPAAVPSVTHAAVPPKWSAAITEARQSVRAFVVERNLPGLSVAVGIDNDIVWAEGFGFADLENRVPVTPEHRFRIGTASTILTSAGAGLLLEQGRLKLDEPIQTYVPEFPAKPWPITLRHLMTHRSGLPSDGGDEGPLLSQHCTKPAEAIPHFGESPLLFQPGTRYRFSNYDWILVSAAIEAASGQSFSAFMQDRVFEPLNLRETLSGSTEKSPQGRAISYFPRFASDPKYGPDPMRAVEYSCYAGASDFLSTPSDLVRFGLAIAGGKLLRPDTLQLLGWDHKTIDLGGHPTHVAGQDGRLLGGTAVSFVTIPERDVVIAITSNISYAGTFSIATKIAETFVL